MYLLPTEEELDMLYRQINPTLRLLDYLSTRPPTPDSMAELFLESEDLELAMEDECIDYRDEEIFKYGKKVSWKDICDYGTNP